MILLPGYLGFDRAKTLPAKVIQYVTGKVNHVFTYLGTWQQVTERLAKYQLYGKLSKRGLQLWDDYFFKFLPTTEIIAEARMRDGFQFTKLEEYNWWIHELHWAKIVGTGNHLWTEQNNENFLNNQICRLGNPYDFRGLPGYLLRRMVPLLTLNFLQIPTSDYCSEAINEDVKKEGFYFNREKGDFIAPDDIRTSKITENLCEDCK